MRVLCELCMIVCVMCARIVRERANCVVSVVCTRCEGEGFVFICFYFVLLFCFYFAS